MTVGPSSITQYQSVEEMLKLTVVLYVCELLFYFAGRDSWEQYFL